MSKLMPSRVIAAAVVVVVVFAAALGAAAAAAILSADDGTAKAAASPAAQSSAGRYFEMRTYHAAPGKLDALNARFRDHTMKLFEKHGMTNIGYWTPQDSARSQNTLVYLLAHKSREAGKASFDAFRKDPDWVKARTESEATGPIVVKVDSVFLTPTDYSPMK